MALFNNLYFNSGETPNACNGRSSPFNYVAGKVTQLNYKINAVSGIADNVVKATFIELPSTGIVDFDSYHTDFYQSYNADVSSANYTGFNTVHDKYTVNQLNASGVVTGQGVMLRWIPGDLEKETVGYIQQTSEAPFVSTGDDAGVLFAFDAATNTSTAWGSSVKQIYGLTNVYKIVCDEVVGASDTGAGDLPVGFGEINGTGILSDIKIRKVGGTTPSTSSFPATGYVFAVKTNSEGKYILYVHLLSSSQIPTSTIPFTTSLSQRADETSSYGAGTFMIEGAHLIDNGNPCFRYTISLVRKLDVGINEHTTKRVEFRESGTVSDRIAFDSAQPEIKIFQRKWDTFLEEQEEYDTVEGEIFGWIPEQAALYIDECESENGFKQEYGPFYQQLEGGNAVWGNRGFTTNCKFTEPKSGRFINIDHSPTNLYTAGKDLNGNWESGGETLIQALTRPSHYNANNNYVVGEKIFQLKSNVDYDYASATVVSWEFPDITNPADKSAMKLVARLDTTGPTQPGNYIDTATFQPLNVFTVGDGVDDLGYMFEGQILPFRLLNDTEGGEWDYVYNADSAFFTDKKDGVLRGELIVYPNMSATPVVSNIGTTRIRAVSLGPVGTDEEAAAGRLYKFFLFDTELTELDSIFGDTSSISYSDGTSNKQIVDIALVSGRKNFSEVFPSTGQTISVSKTIIFEPSKDKLFLQLPTGKIFENVIAEDTISIELQKIFTKTFASTNELTWVLGDDIFLTAEANVNWFIINSDDGTEYSLVPGAIPDVANNEIGYTVEEDGTQLTLTAPTTIGSVTLFAKTIKSFTQDDIRERTLKSTTEKINGLEKGTKKSNKNQYFMKLMASAGKQNGIVQKIVSVYVVDQNNIPLPGTSDISSLFVFDNGVTDQKITNAQLILASGVVKSNGKLDGTHFGTPGVDVNAADFTFLVAYDYYLLSRLTEGTISTRESFIDSSGDVISNSDVPFHFSKNTGSIVHESAIIDFRPIQLGDGDSFGSTKIVPHPDWADTIDVSYYLPRRDKLILNKNGTFEVLYGTAHLSPKYPTDKPGAMTLYTIEKDPYIFGPSSIKSKMNDNRRFTMRDIGKIEKRVQALEYYTTLSLMEKKAQDMLILDANGNNRFKSGILVDTFEGHKIGDVSNRDYNIAIDFDQNYLRPPFITHNNNFVLGTQSESFNAFTELSKVETGLTTGIFMFPYDEVVYVAQPLATRAITVQPHDTLSYEGIADVFPAMDTWVDTNRRPEVRVNLAGENDAWNQMVSSFNNSNIAPFGTQWGEWETLSRTGTRTVVDNGITSTRVAEDWHLVRPGHAHGGTGAGQSSRTIENISTQTVSINETLEQIRAGITRSLSSSTTDVSMGDRVVDVSIVPYMRAKNIKISVRGLKPTTRMYVFFDGINVAEFSYNHVSASAMFNFPNNSLFESFPFPGSNFPQATGGVSFATGASADLKSTSGGNLFVEFRLPDGMFRIGDRKIEITSDPRNNKQYASTYATAVYSASGLRTEIEETVATTRSFQISDPINSSENQTINMTGVFQDTSVSTVVQFRQNDPLAQTFFVNADQHPEGIFLSSVDLYFARKPEDSTNITVQIQVRPSVNGYPDSNKIYPGGKVVKLPSEIVVSDDASVKTTFTFDNPLHLAPGEHALIVKGDTSEYEVYIATLGDFVLGTETKVTNQPYVGVFFTSANASTWSADQNTDLMMVLNKCEFTPNVTYTLPLKNEETLTQKSFELFNVNSRYFDFNSCRSQWVVETSPLSNPSSQTTFTVQPNTNTETDQTYFYGIRTGVVETELPFNLSISALTTNKDVSPVIDLQSLCFFAVKNLVEGNDAANNGETNPYAPVGVSGNVARARYISRIVTLEDGFDSTNMKCTIAINKPIGANIQVFVKTQDTENTDDFHSSPYLLMTPNMSNFDAFSSDTPNDFRDIEFSLDSDLLPFNKFCIKICLYSDNAWDVPKVKDLRAVAIL